MFPVLPQSVFNFLAAVLFIIVGTLLQLIFPVLFKSLSLSQVFTFARIRHALFRSVIILPLYITLGVVLTHIKPMNISQEYKDSFRLSDYYGASPENQNAAVISDNKEALVQRLRLINNAKDSIIISTYDMRDDSSGKAMASLLREAAMRGVKVRILVDGFSAIKHSEKNDIFKTLASYDNVEFKIYSPINILKPSAIMSRLHEKYIIADGSVMLAGGRNTHNGFLGKYPSKGGSIDLDILVWDTKCEGAILESLAHFEDMFALKCCKPHPLAKPGSDAYVKADAFMADNAQKLREDYPEAFEEYDYSERTVPVSSLKIIRNSMKPGPKEPTLWYSLVQLMKSAEKTVDIHTPYLICGSKMYSDLEEAVSGGADFKLTLNSPKTGANLFGAAVYLNEKDKISDLGLSIYEYMGHPSSHTKAILIDDRLSIVGSFNIDMRSAYMNNEQMIVIDSPELMAQLNDYMSYVKSQSLSAADADRQPSEDPWQRRLLVNIVRLVERPLRFLL